MNLPAPTPRSILLVVPQQGLLFEASGIADIFHQANLALAESPQAVTYEVTVATSLPHRVVRGRSGLHLLADLCLSDLDPATGWHTVMVTGRGVQDERPAVAEWLRLAAPHCQRMVSVCAGAFLLAEAGLLDGRRAATHWRLAADLAKRYPRVKVEHDRIYVKDGPIWTSAGASSGLDLTLALVEEDCGPRTARWVAQELVLFLRRPGGQSQFSRFLEGQASPEGPIGEVQTWALENLAGDLSVAKLADRAAMSPRNFSRVFVRETGVPPARFVDQIRLEAARQRLEQGRESLDEVAVACGWETALNLRRAFERTLGVTPTEYRARFGMI
jgi:transcriptional regulator GlxA family with amidase domain